MRRLLFGLPLAGAMMTASIAYAQTNVPSALLTDDVQRKGTGCVDLEDAAAPNGSTEDMQAQIQGRNEGDEDASAGQSASETPPMAGPDAGTTPGGSGSSGWTGGLGGSDIGTSQSEQLESSPAPEPPAVASGLDPITGETAVEGPQAPAEPDEDAQVTPTAPDKDTVASKC